MSKNSKKIKVGDKVLVYLNGEVKELEIVDLPAGNLKEGKISWLSPLAQAVLGHSYPEKVVVKLDEDKTLECEILIPLN